MHYTNIFEQRVSNDVNGDISDVIRKRNLGNSKKQWNEIEKAVFEEINWKKLVWLSFQVYGKADYGDTTKAYLEMHKYDENEPSNLQHVKRRPLSVPNT